MKQTIAPWQDPDSIWRSNAHFDAYIRGLLRRGWSRFPLKNAKLRNNRFKAPIGRYNKDVWAIKCEMCGETFKQSEIQVDHIVEAGSLRNDGGLDGFIARLFPTQDGMALYCHPCHSIKSLATKRNISIEEAVLEKEVIKIMKRPAEGQRQWLKAHGFTDETMPKNTVQRRKTIRETLQHEQQQT